ncbi:MAG: hypothetical protein MJ176_07735 [Treponema sp.]|nr:hypothetical protein [Treponema sp.]
MKKFLSVVLAVFMIALVGCKQNAEEEKKPAYEHEKWATEWMESNGTNNGSTKSRMVVEWDSTYSCLNTELDFSDFNFDNKGKEEILSEIQSRNIGSGYVFSWEGDVLVGKMDLSVMYGIPVAYTLIYSENTVMSSDGKTAVVKLSLGSEPITFKRIE